MELLREFERQGHGAHTLLWMDNISGDFVSSSRKVGLLKVWNVA
jgi:hypothetical protein